LNDLIIAGILHEKNTVKTSLTSPIIALTESIKNGVKDF